MECARASCKRGLIAAGWFVGLEGGVLPVLAIMAADGAVDANAYAPVNDERELQR